MLGDGPQFMPGNVGSLGAGQNSPSAENATQQLTNQAPGSSSPTGATPARVWADNPNSVGLTSTVATIVASALVTPKVTGKLRISITGQISNPGPGTGGVTVSVSHGAAATPADYTQGTSVKQAFTTNSAWLGLVVDLDQIATPVVFPLGTQVQINAVVEADGGTMSVPAHGLQLEVQEVY